MSTQDFSSTQVICGSCMFWAGDREVVQNGKKAKCEFKAAPCLKNKPQTKTPNSASGCSKWEMWPLLKK
jgi:hypothetical protein